MGAAASALPETLSEGDLKNACGESYNPIYFVSLKEGGMVKRDFFLSVAAEGVEQEVFQLFLSFAHSGEIDSRTFVKLLKDTKTLNKKSFTSNDADLVFSKFKAKHGGSVKSLNYHVFRLEMIPSIAEKKGFEEAKIMEKLSKCDGPHLHATKAVANRFHDDKSTYTGAHAQGGPSFENDSGQVDISNTLDRSEADVRGIKVQGHDIVVEDSHHAAALKVQTIHRKKCAVKHVDSLREIKKEVETVTEDSFQRPGEGDAEAGTHAMFMKFCPKGEMESKTFVKMLRDAHMISKKFTTTDADLIFQKTKAMASAPGAGSYSSGVVHGKRVNYEVFRAVTIPLIAKKQGVEVEALLTKLAACEGPTLHGATTAQATRFHDDQSTYTGTHHA